jgi:Tfp pilus assembly protein PilF
MLAVVVLLGAGVAAYWNSFAGQFVFDDEPSILENPSITDLRNLGQVLRPPRDSSTSGRPLVNLTLALNYAVGGVTDLWTYHAFNLAIHLLAALVLMGVMRRTLLSSPLRDRFGRSALPLAAAVALLWMLHPLQVQAVTYITQRAESMVSLFYLLTLYCTIRSAGSATAQRVWTIGAILACAAGMASKEVMVTAPVTVLVYDRLFLTGGWRKTLARRWFLYAGLAATWLILAGLMWPGPRSATTGFGLKDPTPFQYATTEFGVILYYLRLAVWPSPLILDYGWPWAKSLTQVLPAALAVGALVTATCWLLWRGRPMAMAGAWFFLILAPTSSFVPIADPIFEHRMYLALAAVVATVVMLADWAWGRLPPSLASVGRLPAAVRWAIPVAIIGALAAGETYLTVLRNNDYRSPLSIWQDTVRKAPANSRARYNLGNALASRGRGDQAIQQYQQALKLKPDYAKAHNNLGNALASRGQVDQAIEQYRQALKSKPDFAEVHNNLGNALAAQGQLAEAIEQFQQALKSKPDFAEVHNNLGNALAAQGQLTEAADQYQQALKSKPDFAEAHNNLGSILAAQGRLDEAIHHFERALQLKPDYASARENLNKVLARPRAGQPATRSAPDGPTRP